MDLISVKLTSHAYPLYIGSHLLNEPTLLLRHIRAKQAAIICDETVAAHYLKPLESALHSLHTSTHIIPTGEMQKNLHTVDKLIGELIAAGHHRHTTLIGLGGGVISDITGFIASCYMRGVSHFTIPTTLLAQVDASIGGKTGINHASGKNMIGTIYQPQCVIIDSTYLMTLPDREFRSGLTEVIKHAIIEGDIFFHWLEQHMPRLLQRDLGLLNTMITHSCRIKASIVEQDEQDTQNIRQLLNLGHTFGHALEIITHHQLKHGEAVSIGIAMAATLSVKLGLLDDTTAERIKRLLQQAGLPLLLPHINYEEMISVMKADKKRLSEDLTLIVVEGLGKVTAVKVPVAKIQSFLKKY